MRHVTNYAKLLDVAHPHNSDKFKLWSRGRISRECFRRFVRSEERWKSVIWCICQNINIFFRLFHNGSSCDTRLRWGGKTKERKKKCFCERSIFPHSTRLHRVRAWASPYDTRLVFERTHNGFGGLFENELQFPPDVWWKSTECDLMDDDGWMCDKKVFFFYKLSSLSEWCTRELKQLCEIQISRY